MKPYRAFSTLLIIATFAGAHSSASFADTPSAPGRSDGGNGGRGGGDSVSERIRKIAGFLGEDGNSARAVVAQITANLEKIRPATAVGEQLYRLVDSGLAADIQASPYILSEKCVDESGEERSASTLNRPESSAGYVSAPICINVRKLAMESSTDAEVIGLLFHEHARHFGLNDTVALHRHPIAELITQRYTALTDPKFSLAKSILPGLALHQVSTSSPNIYGGYEGRLYLVFTNHSASVRFTVNRFIGNCTRGKAKVAKVNWAAAVDPEASNAPGKGSLRFHEAIDYFHGTKLGKFSEGREFPLDEKILNVSPAVSRPLRRAEKNCWAELKFSLPHQSLVLPGLYSFDGSYDLLTSQIKIDI